MRIAIYISDLKEYNSHLMPWRMVLEVAASLGRLGVPTLVLSGQRGVPVQEWKNRDTHVMVVPKPDDVRAMQQLETVCHEEKIERLYWPVAWWRPRKDVAVLEKQGLQIVWYVPGAWYEPGQVLKASLSLGIKKVLPYLAQALSLKRCYVRKLSHRGKRPLIAMTDYSREMIIRSGYPAESVYAIPPGKSSIARTGESPVIFDRIYEKIRERPYFLYFGPPQAIRGVYQLFSAFKYVAREHLNACLVCLFRSDLGLSTDNLKGKTRKMRIEKELVCIWDSVVGEDLDAFLSNCYAVVKPFVLVPSEIPLSVIESSGYGKPVISTGPGGTGLFAEQFGIMVPSGNAKALGNAMLRLLVDKELYLAKCRAASRVYERHPTWDEVAKRWLVVGSKN